MKNSINPSPSKKRKTRRPHFMAIWWGLTIQNTRAEELQPWSFDNNNSYDDPAE
jgi:hypothetical protein